MTLTITDIVHKIAEFFGLPSLVVEVGFLLIVTVFLLIFTLIFLAILKSAKALVQMNKNAGYIAGLITHRYNYLKHYEGQFYFKPKEWQDETKHIVLEMLKEGKSYDEIKERVDVTRGYVDLIERIAIKKGVLPKR